MPVFREIRLLFRRPFNAWSRSFTIGLRGLSRYARRVFGTLWSWCRARSLVYLLQGLPALFAGIAVIIGVGKYLALPAHEVEARYQDRAAAAFKAREFPVALVCYERLAALGKDRPENLYEMAVALEAQGQLDRAFDIMNQLAPPDRTGYGRAHQWQAVRYWKNLGDPQQRKLAEAHLKRALEAGVPDPDGAHGLLGELYAQAGLPDLAELHLERAVKSRLHVRLRFAQVLAAQGKKARAADEAKLAANYFKTRAQADVNDKLARAGWAECVTFLEDFPQALAILVEGYHLSNDADYKLGMARVYTAWHFFVVAKDADDVATQWSLLERGLQLDGTNVQLLDRLLSLLGRGGEHADKARTVMHNVLAKGQATATAHFLLGMDAWQRDDQIQAQVHLERAYELSPNMPVVANNLAWLLANASKGGDPPRALKLIDLVLDKFPQEPGYRDTRAHVYIKMARWRDALTDLEWVLQRDPAFPTIHNSLATVYAELRMPQAAAEHRRLAEARERKRKSAN